MSEGKWTPGPWYVCGDPPNDFWHRGRTIGSEPNGTRVADIGRFTAEEIALADASLIAAAPDLYEALYRLLADLRLSGYTGGASYEAFSAMAENALAKARGDA